MEKNNIDILLNVSFCVLHSGIHTGLYLYRLRKIWFDFWMNSACKEPGIIFILIID